MISILISRTGVNWNDFEFLARAGLLEYFGTLTKAGINWNDMNVLSRIALIGMINVLTVMVLTE